MYQGAGFLTIRIHHFIPHGIRPDAPPPLPGPNRYPASPSNKVLLPGWLLDLLASHCFVSGCSWVAYSTASLCTPHHVSQTIRIPWVSSFGLSCSITFYLLLPFSITFCWFPSIVLPFLHHAHLCLIVLETHALSILIILTSYAIMTWSVTKATFLGPINSLFLQILCPCNEALYVRHTIYTDS